LRKAEIARRVDEALARVNLRQFKARKPSALSGGQQQRVAVARALVYEPSVILMDEPLGALDRQLRRHMQIELRDLQKQLGTTCVLVTHDQEEALTMSDRVGVMSHGKLLQLDTPTNLYRSPVNDVVANFIGDTNFFEGTSETSNEVTRVVVDSDCQIPIWVAPVADGQRLVVGIRPEFVRMGTPDIGAETFTLKVRIAKIRFLGSMVELAVRTEHGAPVIVRMSLKESLAHHVGEYVTIWWLTEDQTVHAPSPGGASGGEEVAEGEAALD
jgi:putative spermidine/putrescine transport system ATP-binding protein